MSRGRGSSKTGGKSGVSKSSGVALGQPRPGSGMSNSTGPNEGIGRGARPPGTPEKTTFKKERIGAREMAGPGELAGEFLTEDPAVRGEVTVKKGGALDRAVRELSEEVEKEPLPVEQREQIRKFHELILGERESGGSTER